MTEIRPLSPRDLDAALEIEGSSFPDPWDREKFSGELALPFTRSAAAFDRDILLGYVVVRVAGGEASVMNLAVAPASRRRGIGGELLSAAASLAKEGGAGGLYLEVRARNLPALELYGASGFKVCGLRKRYYGDDDAILMERKIR